MTDYRSLSLWHDQYAGSWNPRPALPGDTEVDVAIVGAGYTGLWTALYLAQQDPTLRIAVLEREVAGFGASGRNGGWCSALFPTSWERMARDSSRQGVQAMQAALEDAVDEVGRAGIDCGYAKGGMVALARGPAQLARARAEVEDARRWGFGPETLDLLDATQTLDRVRATRTQGAVTTAHCAALDPARLVSCARSSLEKSCE